MDNKKPANKVSDLPPEYKGVPITYCATGERGVDESQFGSRFNPSFSRRSKMRPKKK